MFPHNENLYETVSASTAAPPSDGSNPLDDPNPESKKRNSGHTGPTSPEDRATSSRNAIKHGACAKTLILPHESVADWELPPTSPTKTLSNLISSSKPHRPNGF